MVNNSRYGEQMGSEKTKERTKDVPDYNEVIYSFVLCL